MNQETSSELLTNLSSRLGMDAQAQTRLDQLPPPADLRMVDDAAAEKLMQFSSIELEDRQAMLAARPDPVGDPDWWLLLQRCVAELRQNMDQPLPSIGYTAWPVVPEAAGPVGMFI